MATTSVRLPDDLLSGLDELARADHTDRSVVLRRAIERGLEGLRVERAVSLYQRGEGSLGWCAKQAGVDLWRLIDELKRQGMGVATDEQHLRDQLGALE